jgi:hypothetical protein
MTDIETGETFIERDASTGEVKSVGTTKPRKPKGTLHRALLQVQQDIGAAAKNAINPHFKSSYADLTSVREASIPVFSANDIVVQQGTGYDEQNRFVLETTLTYVPTGEQIRSAFPLPEQGNSHALGSALSYARRYSLSCLAGLTVADDDGNDAVKTQAGVQTVTPQTPTRASPEVIAQRLIAELLGPSTAESLNKWAMSDGSQKDLRGLTPDQRALVRDKWSAHLIEIQKD